MARTAHSLTLDDVTDETPLLLHLAARLAFPDGTMTISGLRRERDRGHLDVERIANREYTTWPAAGFVDTWLS